ncbi:MAG: winged helix-turn-helix transcriptional regulator [Bacteroidales bacterium]|nr:winged helix-turn-helix transcriptional regulator [Bacteroidales bacterium]
MKMTLKNKIALSLEVLSDCDSENCMHANDKDVVFYSSVLLGSKLSRDNSNTLMDRDAPPKWWKSSPRNFDCTINEAFKKAYVQVVEYIERELNITPGRVYNLLEIYWESTDYYYYYYNGTLDNESVKRFLINLNNLRSHLGKMTESEIYDFSFDMAYDFINEQSLFRESLFLSLMIMYWIQRECHLIPLPVTCDKEEFLRVLGTKSEGIYDKSAQKNFRLFMRKLLDSHLKRFIYIQSKGLKIKISSRDRILKLIKENPRYTAKTMASCLGLSVQAVQKQIANLKKENRIKRIGPDHGGKWAVVQKDR